MNNQYKVFPFIPILTLIFITLKLTNYIDWSWWWVLSPSLIGFSIFISLCMFLRFVNYLERKVAQDDKYYYLRKRLKK